MKTSEQSLIEHLIDLRKRLLICVIAFLIAFAIAYPFVNEIFRFLIQPLANVMQEESETRRLIYTHLTEAFLTQIKLCLFVATLISFPVIASQIWIFIAPGLFKHEKRVFLPFLIISPLLFFCGAAFAYYVIVPNAWAFFISFETPAAITALPIQLEAKIEDYISLMIQFVLAFGLSFQLPLALVLMGRVGILTHHSLCHFRKYAFILILIVSAFLTPPDVLSMIGLAIPLYFLYEGSVFLVGLFERRKNKIRKG